jgi:hypothetical protein
MAFFFTCGTHTFTSPLAGYENVTVRDQLFVDSSTASLTTLARRDVKTVATTALECVRNGSYYHTLPSANAGLPAKTTFLTREWFTICFVVNFTLTQLARSLLIVQAYPPILIEALA